MDKINLRVSQRMVDIWNILAKEVVGSDTITMFNNQLDG